jgi:UDP-N-acetyl-2-amino-2-deoxyglucuronate dehydrogenase
MIQPSSALSPEAPVRWAPLRGPIGFCIIGAGMIARHHARAIRATRGARLISVVGRDPERAAAFAAEQGCASVSMRDALQDARVQAVVITSPSGMHARHGIAAARAGKHLLCEKPLDITLAAIDRLLAASSAAGVLCCPVFQNRSGDAYRVLQRQVARGALGLPLIGRASVLWERSAAYYRSGTWRGSRALDGGGCLMNQSIHTIDLLLHLMGPLVGIQGGCGRLLHAGIEVEDTAVAILRFASGAFGLIEATTATSPQQPATITITGTGGTMAMAGERISALALARPDAISRRLAAGLADQPPEPSEDEARFPKHCRQLQDFIADLRAGRRERSIPAADGRRAVQTILGIYTAARRGRTVTLPAEA